MTTTAEYVAVIGGANVDIHGVPDDAPAMHTSNPGVIRTCPGGVARNIAENLARLNVDTRLVSAVGDDYHGRMLQEQGRAAGIDMRAVSTHSTGPTSSYLSVLDGQGDLQIAVSDMSIVDSVGPDELSLHESMLRQAAIVIVDANLCEDALRYVMQTCTHQPVFADPVSTAKAPRLKTWLANIHTLAPSLSEAETIAGQGARSIEQLTELAAWFHNQGVQRLFVTLGANGVYYSTPEGQGIEPVGTAAPRVRNTGGAGDAFMAGLSFAWLRNWPLERTVQFSMAAAASNVASASTNSPVFSVSSIESSMKSRHAT